MTDTSPTGCDDDALPGIADDWRKGADDLTAQREREWAQTEIGRLFTEYEKAADAAWTRDVELERNEYPSAIAFKNARAAWDKFDAARAAFLTALRGF